MSDDETLLGGGKAQLPGQVLGRAGEKYTWSPRVWLYSTVTNVGNVPSLAREDR